MASENKNRDLLRYAGLGGQWMFMLLAAVWIGYKLDGVTGWEFPLFTILLPVVTLVVSLWKLVKELNKPKK